MNTGLRKLYDTLQRRDRPEDIAAQIMPMYRGETFRLLKEVSCRRSRSYMSTEFRTPDGPDNQVAKAAALFGISRGRTEPLDNYIARLSATINKVRGRSDFASDRYNATTRKRIMPHLSRRRYNKMFRFLRRMEQKSGVYKREERKYQASRIAKSGLATRISWEDFSSSNHAAAFVAYYTARVQRRSAFTNQKQDRHFDEVSQRLLAEFRQSPCIGGWRAIARIFPDTEVIDNLDDQSKMDLLTEWLVVMQDLADLMMHTWAQSCFDREKMIVHWGDDSSTWNALAGAWNAARAGWLSLATALGLTHDNAVCFGKAMRLMAADVVAWHDNGLDPNTFVWSHLPAPWDVFQGKSKCTFALVERVCVSQGLDPVQTGWTVPVSNRQAVPFKPTPDMLHGVTVKHAELIPILRKAGWFSGQKRQLSDHIPGVEVTRDNSGAAIEVGFRDPG